MAHPATTCTRILEFDAAHRVLRHESKCATLHGHRYKVEITCSADTLDLVGRVVDFGVIKERVGGWIDRVWDHSTIVNAEDTSLLMWCTHEAAEQGKRRPYVMPSEPTAENMARLLLGKSRELLKDVPGLYVLEVKVWETPNCYATATLLDTLDPAPQL